MIKQFFVVLISLILVLPVLAQNLSDNEHSYLDEITSAMEVTFEAGTYRLEGGQVLNQYLEFAGTEMTQELIQNMEGEFVILDGSQSALMILEQELAQELNGQEAEIVLTMEMLVNGDGLYLQVTDVAPSELEAIYPDEWILLGSSSAIEYPGLAGINAEQMNQLVKAESLVTPLVNMNEVASDVEMLDDEEIDDMIMTVYHVIANPELVFSDEYMDTVSGLFNFEALGIDPSVMDFEIGDDAVIEYTFYIGQEDGFLYRMESELVLEMTLDGTPLGIPQDIVIEQEVSAEFNLFDFGADIELPIP